MSPAFRAAYAPDDADMVRSLLMQAHVDANGLGQIHQDAKSLITAIRHETSGFGVEAFLQEYSLSTREGLALMVLAEALLRVPDHLTADQLIEDKLAAGHFDDHVSQSADLLLNAAAWGLGVSVRLLKPGETPQGILGDLAKRIGLPAVRLAARQAMRMMGNQFVLGETIDAALDRARAMEAKGYLHSYDMLGEGARTQADAERYFTSYSRAIAAIGKAATGALPLRPGISIKLSALHPRYEATQQARVMAELVPRLVELARMAKAHDLNFTVDAEEADRLELSLDVFGAALKDASLAGWDGFGLAVQAYQKRAAAVIDWLDDLSLATGRRLMVRLVKGAYWDTEIKRAQERGLADYPVYSRKVATDLSYAACAQKLIAARPRLYPQFATHNALTVADIRYRIARSGTAGGYEFQRLHGMGDALYRQVTEADGIPTRIYAPVGGHRDLLAYLVRRLLENGANSSFVSRVNDVGQPVEALLVTPMEQLTGDMRARHAAIPLPKDLFGPQRQNSAGFEFGIAAERESLDARLAASVAPVAAVALVNGKALSGLPRGLLSPVDGRTPVGSVVEPAPDAAGMAISAAHAGFAAWSAMTGAARADILDRAADLLEQRRDHFVALLAREAGKTLADGLSEVREAVDFCRYYARQERDRTAEQLPGPTGESNRLATRGRGVFIAISPWNFPLAIFTGQIAAALVTGNAVIAKPAEQTPLVAFSMVRLLHEAGVPETVLHFMPGDGGMGAALVAADAVAGVVFTGSTEVARAINRSLAAKDGPIVPLVAETGGLNAMIVDATALPEQVCDDVLASAFRSAGQRCSALRLLFLQEDIAGPMLEMIAGAASELVLGDPMDATTDIGPVIDAEAKAALDRYVEAQSDRTYRGITPGGALAGGNWVAPTIIRLAKAADLEREVFGPVLHVVTWKAGELDQVLDQIAATGYGLTLGLHSRISAVVEKVIARLSVGNVYVNRNMIGAVVGVQPFGGSGLSGTGPKAGGPAYLDRFRLEQTITVNTSAAGGNATLVTMGD